MSGFTAEWLALREPADAKARNEPLVDRLADTCAGREGLAILDLGAGSGANLRCLSPRLPMAQHWTLADDDPGLLQRARTPAPDVPVRYVTRVLDLAQDLDALNLEAFDLVTASALMDLVSARWFDALAERCREAAVMLLFTLTYDGRIFWSPEDPLDQRVAGLFNRHQRRDKGFGPALGPEAPAHMEACLTRLGYRTHWGRSDWRLGRDERELRGALLEGYAEAAAESDPAAGSEIAAWRQRRRELIDADGSRLQVGHVDLLAQL